MTDESDNERISNPPTSTKQPNQTQTVIAAFQKSLASNNVFNLIPSNPPNQNPTQPKMAQNHDSLPNFDQFCLKSFKRSV